MTPADRLVEEARQRASDALSLLPNNGSPPLGAAYARAIARDVLALADALEAAERENERLLRECEAWEIVGQEETFAKEAAERRVDELREASDGLLGCIVEGPDGELALVPNSRQEVDRLRAALAERESTEGELPPTAARRLTDEEIAQFRGAEGERQ